MPKPIVHEKEIVQHRGKLELRDTLKQGASISDQILQVRQHGMLPKNHAGSCSTQSQDCLVDWWLHCHQGDGGSRCGR